MGVQTTTEEVAIRTLVDRWIGAMRTKNADAVVSFFAPDNVMFVMAPPLQNVSGSSPGKKGVEDWFATFEGDALGYEVRDLRVHAGRDVAFCHALSHLTGQKVDGEKVDLWYRETLCFVKIGGAWKIAHEHESVPFYMDGSGRAALDLTP